MHVFSLSIKPTFKLNIHNQCLNVDLVSPIYIIDDWLECRRPPDYKVCAGDTMKSGFMIKWNYETGGALIYKPQRKQSHEPIEIGEDASSEAHLLVIWKLSKSKMLYSDVLLVEHDKRLDWNKDGLKELYHKNRFRLCSYSATERWSLDDNVAFMTTFEIMNRSRILNITISEVERDSDTRMPAYIDLKR
jgi:hypothetical protein